MLGFSTSPISLYVHQQEEQICHNQGEQGADHPKREDFSNNLVRRDKLVSLAYTSYTHNGDGAQHNHWLRRAKGR